MKKEKKIYCKIHEDPISMKKVFAAIDADLVGKKFYDEEKDIEFHASESFFKDKLISDEEFKKLLKEHDNINLFGNRVVEIAIEEKIVERKNVKYIKKIAMAQIYII